MTHLHSHFLLSESQEQVPDACKNSEIIPHESMRMYAYGRQHDELPLCDRNLIQEAKWYRATDDMVTNATRPNICGTTYPLWLSGISFYTNFNLYLYVKILRKKSKVLIIHVKTNEGTHLRMHKRTQACAHVHLGTNFKLH